MELKARYCIVFGCLNSNKHIPELSFFSLPKDEERREEWLVAVGREDLLKRGELKIKSYLVCATHFDDSLIKVIKQLKPDAVPTKFLPNRSEGDTHQPGNPNEAQSDDPLSLDATKLGLDSDFTGSPTAATTSGINQRLSTLTADKCSRKRKALEDIQFACKYKRLHEITGNTSTASNADGSDCSEKETISRFQKVAKLGIKIEDKFSNSDAACKAFALNLHYSSPDAYRCLQPLLNFPNKSAISKVEIKIPPKLDKQVLDGLSLKLKSLPPNAKYCTICLGMITLKRNLYYNTKTDEITGFHNINGSVSTQIANQACVLMLQSIYINWSQPFAYTFLANTKHLSELDEWVNKAIRKLFGIGFEVKALISDHKSILKKYATVIKHVTLAKPYFLFDGRKIYYIFDVPNLIESVRDKLLSENLDIKGDVISWDHIKTLYEYEKEKHFRLIPKITNAHIEPNKVQRKELKYATQMFSHTVYAALETYIDFGKITEGARATAKFIKTMNDVFDTLNSSEVKSANKKILAFRMSDLQTQALEDGDTTFANITTTDDSTEERNAKNDIFHIFRITIQSVQLLFKDLKNKEFVHIPTRRLNQDNMDKFLSQVRRIGTHEVTPFKFARAFSKLFSNKMLKVYPNEKNNSDFYDILQRTEEAIKITNCKTSEEPKPTLIGLGGQVDYRIDLPEDNALTYVASYLLFKCSKNHNCDTMKRALKSALNLNKTHFRHYQEYNKDAPFYGHLKMPPKELVKYVDILETYFCNNFEKCLYYRPGSTIYQLMEEISSSMLPCPCFPNKYFLQLFVRLRIFTTIKFNNCSLKANIRCAKQRMKIHRLSL